jgi:hypothetical protein
VLPPDVLGFKDVLQLKILAVDMGWGVGTGPRAVVVVPGVVVDVDVDEDGAGPVLGSQVKEEALHLSLPFTEPHFW